MAVSHYRRTELMQPAWARAPILVAYQRDQLVQRGPRHAELAGRVGFGKSGHGEPFDSAVGHGERSKPLGILPPHSFLHPLIVQIHEAAQHLEVAILVVKLVFRTFAKGLPVRESRH